MASTKQYLIMKLTSKTTPLNSRQQTPAMRTGYAKQLAALLLMALPAVAQAQFGYTTNDGAITIVTYTDPIESVTNISIPSTIDGLPVTSIGANAFKSCYNLTNVTFGNNVTSIGGSAFTDCRRLRSIMLPNRLASIGPSAFAVCSGLANVEIPGGITNIGGAAFWRCTSVTSVTIPSSVTSIGSRAFDFCSSLMAITVDPQNTNYTSVAGVLFDKNQTTLMQCPGGMAGAYTVPDTVTSIGSYAFDQCTNLTSVSIPNTVTDIGSYAFAYCSSLTNVKIPDSIMNIKENTFYYCAGLTDAVLPSGVINIGNSAFDHCTNLVTVTIPETVSSIGLSAFLNCTSLHGVYFQGNAPKLGGTSFAQDNNATMYYLPWTTGWSSTFGGCPTVIWYPQSLVRNGDFEQGDFSQWTLAGTPNPDDPRLGYNQVRSSTPGFSFVVHSGRYMALLGDIQVATLSQALSTVPGQCYLLSLWLDNPSSGNNQVFRVNWNTAPAATNTLFSIVNPPAFSWTNLQFLVSATSTNTTLQIQAENDPNFFGLDDISLTPIPVPVFQTCLAATNGFRLSWSTALGVAYQVQYKTNLLQTNWKNFATSFVATNTSFTLLDTNAVEPSPGRFYRLSIRTP